MSDQKTDLKKIELSISEQNAISWLSDEWKSKKSTDNWLVLDGIKSLLEKHPSLISYRKQIKPGEGHHYRLTTKGSIVQLVVFGLRSGRVE